MYFVQVFPSIFPIQKSKTNWPIVSWIFSFSFFKDCSNVGIFPCIRELNYIRLMIFKNFWLNTVKSYLMMSFVCCKTRRWTLSCPCDLAGFALWLSQPVLGNIDCIYALGKFSIFKSGYIVTVFYYEYTGKVIVQTISCLLASRW